MSCGEEDKTINHIVSECSKLAGKEYKTKHDRGKKDDPLGIVQETEFSSYYQMVYAQTRICPR